jgi:hypothetical protein
MLALRQHLANIYSALAKNLTKSQLILMNTNYLISAMTKSPFTVLSPRLPGGEHSQPIDFRTIQVPFSHPHMQFMVEKLLYVWNTRNLDKYIGVTECFLNSLSWLGLRFFWLAAQQTKD